MKSGYLSEYFVGVTAKRLSAVEAHPEKSNQHEFNGVNRLKVLLGENRLQDIPALFLWIGDGESISEGSLVTWYDARKDDPNRSEFRLYFKSNSVMKKMAKEGDLVIIAKKQSGELMILVADKGSSGENRLLWLFDFTPIEVSNRFSVQHFESGSDRRIESVANFILEELGLPTQEIMPDSQTDLAKFDKLIAPYEEKFPPTAEFSRIARQTLRKLDVESDPDKALLTWLEHEESLFRYMERRLVAQRLEEGFYDGSAADVDEFISYSLSVQNRRKSRAGYALEHHLDEIFRHFELRYERQAKTELNSRPDFLFPGAKEYKDTSFPDTQLSMLGVKSTCKERWRQVLAEAQRIPEKHLLTLEPGISENQTDEMAVNKLQLVLPASLHFTYSESQRAWLMSLFDFIYYILGQQKR